MKRNFSLLVLGSILPFSSALALPDRDIATCSFQQAQENGNITLDFKVYQKNDNLIVRVVQNHPVHTGETSIYRQVKDKSTHDYFQYTNGFDFELNIFPNQKGSFSGKVYGISYENIEISCAFDIT